MMSSNSDGSRKDDAKWPDTNAKSSLSEYPPIIINNDSHTSGNLPTEKSSSINGQYPPNTVHRIRNQIRKLTSDIINHHGIPTENRNLSPSSSNSHNKKDQLPSSSTEKPSNDSNQNSDWDEICIGIWVQDKESRKAGKPGRCIGIEVVRTENYDGNIDDMNLNRSNLVFVLAKTKTMSKNSWATVESDISSPELENESSKLEEPMLDRIKNSLERQYEFASKLGQSVFTKDRMSKVAEMSKQQFDSVVRLTRRTIDRQKELFQKWWRAGDNDGGKET